jgi:hypothetical protein
MILSFHTVTSTISSGQILALSRLGLKLILMILLSLDAPSAEILQQLLLQSPAKYQQRLSNGFQMTKQHAILK